MSPCTRIHITFYFFFNDTATTEIYTLSLHDALPISNRPKKSCASRCTRYSACSPTKPASSPARSRVWRSEEHTSELQSQFHLVCRLLLEKKKKHVTVIYAVRIRAYNCADADG